MKFLVTGGAGFIGSALVRFLIKETDHQVLNIDKLSYAGNLNSLAEIAEHPRYSFKKIDLLNKEELENTIMEFRPKRILHLAAETHVDRSLRNPEDFISANIIATYNLLESIRKYCSSARAHEVILLHVSTDEVFGSLGPHGKFDEKSRYDPSSPYSSSKAASDHLVRAWSRSYGIPAIISNCSNNYGFFQHSEKLIPLTISRAIARKPIPIYGDGNQIRDWLFVEDHVRALYALSISGKVGETYPSGGTSEKTTLEVVNEICALIGKRYQEKEACAFSSLITFVNDRPGHDFRYAIDDSKIRAELGWRPRESFKSGLMKTVDWYLQ